MNNITNKDILINLDIALNKTGLSILDTKDNILYSEVVTVKSHWEYYKKLNHLYEYYLKFFDKVFNLKPKSVLLILEGRLKAGFSGNTLASIEGARTTAYRAYYIVCHKHEVDVRMKIYDPQTVKQYFSGRRNADKELMYKSALSRFSSLNTVEFQEDIYDSLYLGLYHLHASKKVTPSKRKKK